MWSSVIPVWAVLTSPSEREAGATWTRRSLIWSEPSPDSVSRLRSPGPAASHSGGHDTDTSEDDNNTRRHGDWSASVRCSMKPPMLLLCLLALMLPTGQSFTGAERWLDFLEFHQISFRPELKMLRRYWGIWDDSLRGEEGIQNLFYKIWPW